MSTISLRQNHNKDPEELRNLIKQLTVKLEDKYQLTARWLNNDEVEVQRSGIKGLISLAPAEVRVEIKLGMLMRGFKSTIQSEISRSMAEKLG
ncbi:MAG: polyhydroxyalkanoic acid system family protein [Zhongshania sp.]|uniref:polyhydroxyalkanoic acid system family protein n=1 Tax=Zhongshania sp. TaxID=1971902 RepID=UPI0026298068|nr:polyhydroxyalkanoic acid system family protein [Zhongshania sp.]MDF1691072.1 polyhydroxyalkanoic acid system family protein [Zhongshania sp.]